MKATSWRFQAGTVARFWRSLGWSLVVKRGWRHQLATAQTSNFTQNRSWAVKCTKSARSASSQTKRSPSLSLKVNGMRISTGLKLSMARNVAQVNSWTRAKFQLAGSLSKLSLSKSLLNRGGFGRKLQMYERFYKLINISTLFLESKNKRHWKGNDW